MQNRGLSSFKYLTLIVVSKVMLEVKNAPGNAGDIRDAGSIPGSGSPTPTPEKETAIHSHILAWRIPWTEEHGVL